MFWGYQLGFLERMLQRHLMLRLDQLPVGLQSLRAPISLKTFNFRIEAGRFGDGIIRFYLACRNSHPGVEYAMVKAVAIQGDHPRKIAIKHTHHFWARASQSSSLKT